MFVRPAVQPVDAILGVTSTSEPETPLDYMQDTVEKLQLAYELARCSLRERSNKQQEEER